jgi:hypothetical protein
VVEALSSVHALAPQFGDPFRRQPLEEEPGITADQQDRLRLELLHEPMGHGRRCRGGPQCPVLMEETRDPGDAERELRGPTSKVGLRARVGTYVVAEPVPRALLSICRSRRNPRSFSRIRVLLSAASPNFDTPSCASP